MKNLTHDEFEAILVIEEYDENVRNQIQGWLARGDAVAVYQNEDLGHRLLGLHILLSWGSEASQLPRERFPEPPAFCPVDVDGCGPGWRYCLQGVYESKLSQASGTVTP